MTEITKNLSKSCFPALAPRENQDRTEALECVLSFCKGKKVGKKYWQNQLQINTTIIYRATNLRVKNTENILKKKKIWHHLFPYISSCVTYLAKSCGVFVLSPELCLSPAARLPLQSCLNFHHSGTQAHKKCPKIKQVLPLAAGRKKIKIKIKLHI